MTSPQESYLYLLQLADSALPIGAAAHSFGLETLVSEDYLTVPNLVEFFDDYLWEVGRIEAFYGQRAFRLATVKSEAEFKQSWLQLNRQLSALKLSRESREASAVLGKRFLQLVTGLEPEISQLKWALRSAQENGMAPHHAPAFGLVGAMLGIDETIALLAYLQQSVGGQISACQRLMPLGQRQAAGLQWQLKPTMLSIVQHLLNLDPNLGDDYSFAPLAELGSMRHPYLLTRLFVS